MRTHDYKKLKVWQKAMDLVVEIYKLTNDFPQDEKHGIISQLRRASVSIPSNIAEGCRRGTNKYLQQFLLISFGSGGELETQLELSKRLKFGKDYSKADSHLQEVMSMLATLIRQNSNSI